MYDYRARMYVPSLGRFLQRDPAGYIDGFNLYAYVGNNPLAFVDPSGLVPEASQGGGLNLNFRSFTADDILHAGTVQGANLLRNSQDVIRAKLDLVLAGAANNSIFNLAEFESLTPEQLKAANRAVSIAQFGTPIRLSQTREQLIRQNNIDIRRENSQAFVNQARQLSLAVEALGVNSGIQTVAETAGAIGSGIRGVGNVGGVLINPSQALDALHTSFVAEPAIFAGNLRATGASEFDIARFTLGFAINQGGLNQVGTALDNRNILTGELLNLSFEERLILGGQGTVGTISTVSTFGAGVGTAGNLSLRTLQFSSRSTRRAAIRDALTDSNGRLLSKAERNGIKFTIRRIEAQGFSLDGAIKFRGNQGIDLSFTGIGQNTGRFALAEAKASGGLGSLSRDALGIRQGSFRFFETRLERAGRIDLLDELGAGNVDLFGGFQGSNRLFQFDPVDFFDDVNFRTTPSAARLIE